MKYLYISILLVALACQQLTKEKIDQNENTVLKVSQPEETEQSQAEESKDKETLQNPGNLNTNKQKIWVDHIFYFNRSDEFYVTLNLNDKHDWKALDTIKNYSDSIVFQDEEIKRTNFPLLKAEEFFSLELLNGITIFNELNQNQGKSKLKRIEYFEDVLGDQFIAIMEPEKKITGKNFYGINGADDLIKPFNSYHVSPEISKDSILKIVNNKSKYDWHTQQIKVKSFDMSLLVYSFLSSSNEEKSYLFELDSSGNKKSIELTNDFSIWDVSATPVSINNKPVLLLWLGVPESDIEWYSPAIFDGEKYKIIKSRIFTPSEY